MLLGSGLRVSEVLGLDREQYTGKGFARVAVKGGGVPVQREARQMLEAWLASRAGRTTPLPSFPPAAAASCCVRREAAAIIRRIAAQANAPLPEAEKIEVSPHVLRHMFLRKLAETKGVQYAREASGHQSDRYIWRDVKPDHQTLAEAIDEWE